MISRNILVIIIIGFQTSIWTLAPTSSVEQISPQKILTFKSCHPKQKLRRDEEERICRLPRELNRLKQELGDLIKRVSGQQEELSPGDQILFIHRRIIQLAIQAKTSIKKKRLTLRLQSWRQVCEILYPDTEHEAVLKQLWSKEDDLWNQQLHHESEYWSCRALESSKDLQENKKKLESKSDERIYQETWLLRFYCKNKGTCWSSQRQEITTGIKRMSDKDLENKMFQILIETMIQDNELSSEQDPSLKGLLEQAKTKLFYLGKVNRQQKELEIDSWEHQKKLTLKIKESIKICQQILQNSTTKSPFWREILKTIVPKWQSQKHREEKVACICQLSQFRDSFVELECSYNRFMIEIVRNLQVAVRVVDSILQSMGQESPNQENQGNQCCLACEAQQNQAQAQAHPHPQAQPNQFDQYRGVGSQRFSLKNYLYLLKPDSIFEVLDIDAFLSRLNQIPLHKHTTKLRGLVRDLKNSEIDSLIMLTYNRYSEIETSLLYLLVKKIRENEEYWEEKSQELQAGHGEMIRRSLQNLQESIKELSLDDQKEVQEVFGTLQEGLREDLQEKLQKDPELQKNYAKRVEEVRRQIALNNKRAEELAKLIGRTQFRKVIAPWFLALSSEEKGVLQAVFGLPSIEEKQQKKEEDFRKKTLQKWKPVLYPTESEIQITSPKGESLSDQVKSVKKCLNQLSTLEGKDEDPLFEIPLLPPYRAQQKPTEKLLHSA